MGSDIGGLVKPVIKEMVIENFMGKKIAIDAFNTIYQFLSIIKGSDGKPLMNYSGKITSHLSGLLYRNTMFLEKGIKIIYVFDGTNKSEKLRWTKNNPNKDNIRIDKEIIESSKKLLSYLGIPVIEGTAEGEAQCCLLNNTDQCFAVASQDYDCLAFGGKRLIRNFAINAKRKKGDTYMELPVEYINAIKFFQENQITRNMLIDIVFLIGNDFFPGIKGIGEKTALKLIKEKDSAINLSFNLVFEKKDGTKYKNIACYYDDLNRIRTIFLSPNVSTNYNIDFKKPKLDKLKELLIEEHNFNSVRVDNVIKRLDKACFNKIQTNLNKFW